MPSVYPWFPKDRIFEWERLDRSIYDGKEGPFFYTYPLTWLIPFVNISEDILREAPSPIWITEIPLDSPIGKENSKGDCGFVIDLPKTFDEYLTALPYDKRKKMRYNLRCNTDISVSESKALDMEPLWEHYVARIQHLGSTTGLGTYTDEELAIRKEFFLSAKIRYLSAYYNNQLVAVNVAYFDGPIVYDLATLQAPDSDLRKRGLGVFITLKNIEFAILEKIQNYDLLAGEYGYKASFGAQEGKQKHYLKCSRKFAETYGIPIEEVSEIIED